jgi:hypothetical protein
MPRLKILANPRGGGKPVLIGEVEDSGFSYSRTRGDSGRGRLGRPGCHELIRLLGDGYMQRRFQVFTAGTLLNTCQIVLSSGHIEFVFDSVHDVGPNYVS